MAKNLDGIKKLNPEEIKRNRKIVLSYIGEKDSELTKKPKTAGRIASVFNRVDGIKLNRISNLKLKAKNMLDGPAPVIDNQANKQEKINLEKERARREKIEQEELARKELVKKAEFLAEEKAKAETARKWSRLAPDRLSQGDTKPKSMTPTGAQSRWPMSLIM